MPFVSEVVLAIEEYQPSAGNWLGLASLVEELFASGSAWLGIGAMLGVFERFPSEAGGGVFWSIVHGLESLPGYESKLVQSIQRAPSDFSLLMLNRLLNQGCGRIDGVDLLALLAHVAEDNNCSPHVRKTSRRFLDHHGR